MRARKILSGEQTVLSELSKHPEAVIFLAKDAGANIQKKIKNKANTYQCTLIIQFTKDELSHAMGQEHRTVAICTDSGFNKTFKEYNHK